MSTIREQCAATKSDWQRCRGNALEGSRYCFACAPELKQRRLEENAKGGKHKSSLVRLERMIPARLVPVYSRLELVLDELHEGQLDPKVAHAMAAVARAMVSVLQVGEMEERLRELEEKVQHQVPSGWWLPLRRKDSDTMAGSRYGPL
jgi:hypothetical protein